jgi:hypothetical protein
MDDWTASATAAAVPPPAPYNPSSLTLDEARSFMDDNRPFFRKSPVVATGGNQSQIGSPRKPRKHAKAVAVGT